MAQTIPLRAEIAHEHTWDTASIFASDAAWEAELEQISTQLDCLSAYKGHLGQSATKLADWFQTSEALLQRVGKVFIYASMNASVDTTDQVGAAQQDRADMLYSRAVTAMAFAEPELLSIGFERLRQWIAGEERLSVYRHAIDELERNAAHVRSAEVEALLGQAMDPFGSALQIHSTLADADMRFDQARGGDGEAIAIGQGNINALLRNPDREIRRTAWEHYADAHLAVKNSAAGCLRTAVKQHVFLARARSYQSSLDAALSPNYIPVPVFHRLIETYRRYLPTWHRYWKIRREALGYDQLQVYDIKAPLTQAAPDVSFSQAMDWIAAGMQPLGDDYVGSMRRGVEEQRWVDIYPNQGKSSGAFSTGAAGTLPFILMSYNDDLFSMSTLAHELGHSMHSYYTWKTQPYVYSSYSLFVAEVASNFNQALVRAHLLATKSDPDFQITVIEEAMSNFHRYFFIMPTLARFELAIHERAEKGGALTADYMIALLADLFREGYGDEVVIDADRIGITWAQFSSHLYANFYVYQYATGIAAAQALARNVLNGSSQAVTNYIEFLQAGSSMYPIDALRRAGVDMNSSEPVEQAFAVLGDMVDRLAELRQSNRKLNHSSHAAGSSPSSNA